MSHPNDIDNSLSSRLKAYPWKLIVSIINTAKSTKKLGEDDPRRVFHSCKVGFAMILVSLLYYIKPFNQYFGGNGIWAVVTVVIVFEFSVGATLSKGLNRALATLAASGLGVGVHYLGRLFGRKSEPIAISFFLFILGAAATFSRFFPVIKKKYDYGMSIFILTFSMVSVSGYWVPDIIKIAQHRLSTIMIGGTIGILVAVFICPVWAGQDLEDIIVDNLENLASFFEAFNEDYYKVMVPVEGGAENIRCGEEKSFVSKYKSALNSKAKEDSHANYASWEPSHGKFRFGHPWKQYLKLGDVIRQCAYHVNALHSYIDETTQASSEFKWELREPFTKISTEAGKTLKELAKSIKSTTHPVASYIHLQKCKDAVDELRTSLRASIQGKPDIVEVLPVIKVATVLIDISKCVEKVVDSTRELAKEARFKKSGNSVEAQSEKPLQSVHRGAINPVHSADDGFIDIIIHQIPSDSSGGGDHQRTNK